MTDDPKTGLSPGMSYQIIGGPRLEISETAFWQMTDQQRRHAMHLLREQARAMVKARGEENKRFADALAHLDAPTGGEGDHG